MFGPALFPLLFALTPLDCSHKVVMFGDSIVFKTNITVMWEALKLAHEPECKLDLWISGHPALTYASAIGKLPGAVELGGDTVILAFGMNDGTYKAMTPAISSQYERNIGRMIDAIRLQAEPDPRIIVLSPPAVEPATYTTRNGCDGDCYNGTLDAMRAIAQTVANAKSVEFIDIFTPMKTGFHALANTPVRGGTDGVHPGFAGALLFAAALQGALAQDREVGSLEIDAKKGGIECKRCTIQGLSLDHRRELRFERTDKARPFVVPDEPSLAGLVDARAVWVASGTLRARNSYKLKVTGLDTGNWRLSIDGVDGPSFSASELARGVELGDLSLTWQLGTLEQEARSALIGEPRPSEARGIRDRQTNQQWSVSNFQPPAAIPRFNELETEVVLPSLRAFRASYASVLDDWRRGYQTRAEPGTRHWRLYKR